MKVPGKTIFLVVAVVALLVMCSGIWLALAREFTLNIPEEQPVIFSSRVHHMGGAAYYLYIYADGIVWYVTEEGLRFPSPEHPAVRTWYQGSLPASDINGLVDWILQNGLEGMKDYSSYLDERTEDGPFTSSDMIFKVVVNDSDNQIVKAAADYICEKGNCPDMPEPMREIYKRLYGIAEETTQVYSKKID
ncbi:MAG: hypothetical protein JW712_08580 [Dehalococcoidales bacterium]|nr:hypothetical protein [Dehalococcoidales bacterium]